MGKNRPRNYFGLPARLRPIGLAIVGLGLIGWTQSQLLKPGAPFSHDGQNHLVRMAHYYLTIKEGQFPPRFSGNINNGFGYPVFNFNYPLVNIFAYPFVALDLPIWQVFNLLTLLALVVGFSGFYLWLKLFVQPKAALLGAIVYSLNPYIYNLIYVRGSIGELWALALLPWLFWSMSQPPFWLAIIGGMFLLSHNVLVLFAIPFLLLYFGWLNRRQLIPALRTYVLAGLAAGCLAAFFWIPALWEKQFTVLDGSPITKGYQKHFLNIGQLVTGSQQYGFSYAGPVDGLNFSLGAVSWVIVLVAILLVFLGRQKRLGWLLLALGLLLFMMLPASNFIWNMIPIIQYIQFPWRLLVFAHLELGFIGALVYQKTNSWRLFWAGIVFILLLQAKAAALPVERVTRSNQDLFYATETTSTLDENMPKDFNKNQAFALKESAFKDQVVISEAHTSKIAVTRWNGSNHAYHVTVQEPDRLIERTAYFPGWEVKANGAQLAIEPNQEPYQGLITYTLDPGEYTIVTKFTQNTWPRLLGNVLTLVGMLGCIILGFRGYVKR